MNKVLDNIKDEATSQPKHVAIIMDGNGRWASKRHRPRTYGHKKAEKAIRESVEYCIEKQTQALTFFVFSTENWHRPKDEVSFLMELLSEFLKKSRDLLHEHKIKLVWLGCRDNVPAKVREDFENIIKETSHYTTMQLCLAVDYGAKDEITHATKQIASLVKNDKMTIEQINEKVFEGFLYTNNLPPLDLVIRTSGEHRLSNFLLWQAAYSELYFCDTLWPDFSRSELDKAFTSFKARKRRWGRVKSKSKIN